MSYRGYYIALGEDDIFTVEIAPGNILEFETLTQARQFIDSICSYNES